MAAVDDGLSSTQKVRIVSYVVALVVVLILASTVIVVRLSHPQQDSVGHWIADNIKGASIWLLPPIGTFFAGWLASKPATTKKAKKSAYAAALGAAQPVASGGDAATAIRAVAANDGFPLRA